MNRLSWDTSRRDTSSPRRPHAKRPDASLQPADHAPHGDILRPAWLELRRIHRF